MKISGMAESALASLKGKGAFDILIGTFATRLVSFLGSLVLVRLMSKADYGVLSYMENLYTYVFIFAGYGLNYAVLRYCVKADSVSAKKGVFLFSLKHGTLFNLALVVVTCVVAVVYPHSSEFEQARMLLPIMLTAVVFSYIFDTCVLTLRALFKNRLYAVVSVTVALIIWLVKIFGNELAGLEGAVWSWPLSYFVLSLLLLAYFCFGEFARVHAEPVERPLASEMRGYSVQYMVTNGLWAVFAQNDLLLIGLLMADSASVAEYKVAYMIPATLAIASSSVNIFVGPHFVKHEDDRGWVWRNYKLTVGITALAIGLLSVLLFAFAPELVSFVFGEQYSETVPIVRLLLIGSFVTNALRATTANILASMGQVRVNLIAAAVGIVVQVVLDVVLIPLWGLVGAAMASLVTFSVMAVIVNVVFYVRYRPNGY